MRTHTLFPLLTLTLALAAPPPVRPQAGTPGRTPAGADDWQGLGRLEPGKRVLVEFLDARREPAEGEFVGVSGGKLILTSDGDTLSLERRDLERVYRVRGRWSRGKAARVGAGVGMLIGTWVGVGRALRNERRPGRAPSDADMTPAFVGMGVGTAAGAGAGVLVAGKRRGALLYEAK